MILKFIAKEAQLNLLQFSAQKQEKAKEKFQLLLQKVKEKNKNKSKKKRRKRTAISANECIVHSPEILSNLHYLNLSMLRCFMNEKGFINKGRFHSVCAKHQRVIRKNIILARHLHLLPYIIY